MCSALVSLILFSGGGGAKHMISKCCITLYESCPTNFTDRQTNRHLAFYDFVWLCMTIFEYAWLCTTMYQYVWQCMTMYVYVWLFMSLYDYVWLCMAMYDYVWQVGLNWYFTWGQVSVWLGSGRKLH